MSEPTPWHRLFGLSLVDFFRGMPVTVEMEKDLSLKQQMLDVVLIHKGPGPLNCRLPDGFDPLASHNLVTFKSHQESLDGWALNELLGHYVNYRKQTSPSMQELLPESNFRLLAVSVRFPQNLSRETTLTPVQPGVYDVRHFTGLIRIIVVHELPQADHNAMLHLFSARPDLLQYGASHHRPRSQETSTLLRQLFTKYPLEGIPMSEIMDRIAHDPQLFQKMTPEEVLKRLAEETMEELVKQMPIEERLRGLSTDEVLAALS